MKIVLVFESLSVWGGVEKVQWNMSTIFTKLWHDVTHLLLEDKQPRNMFSGEIYCLERKFVFWFGWKKILLLFQLAYDIAKYCKKNQADIVVGQGDFFYMATAFSKILFWNPAYSIAVVHSTIQVWPTVLQKVLIFLLKRHKKIVLISQEEYKRFQDIYKITQEKLSHIPNAIKEYNWEYIVPQICWNDRYTFINIWRLTDQKNQSVLITAFSRFHKKYNNSQLIILWEWDKRVELQKLIVYTWVEGKVHMLWNKENVYSYLHWSDCFVLSSKFEGFGMVLWEALDCSLPIISTNCPTGPTELMVWKMSDSSIEKTEHGILVPYNNDTEEFLYEALVCMYTDRKLQEACRGNAKKRLGMFSQEKISKKWKELFKKII